MSKENVAKFIRTVAEKPELNQKVASSPRQTSQWVKLANEAGFTFNTADFVGFVSDMTERKVSEDDAVAALLTMNEQLDDAQLDQVAGGVLSTATLQFSPQLQTRIGSQFGGVGGIASSFVKTSGPSFVKSYPSGGAGGGQL